MRIVHVKNPANLAWRLAEGQRKLGHEAIVWSRGDRYGFPYDVLMPSGAKWNLWLLKKLPELSTFDILHVHGGAWRGDVAYKVISILLSKMPIFIHCNGSEARHGGGLHWMSISDGTFYTDPDIARFMPEGSVWVPQPIDTSLICNASSTENERPVFVHVPSAPELKGTNAIKNMFQQTFPNGEAELRIVSGVTHKAALNAMREADIVFDQISPMGIYGFTSVEAMALGKPVLATLDRNLYPADCPVIYPCATKLMELAYDVTGRRHYGSLGRAYVERVHSSTVVARKVLDAYEAVL